jgi:hypothetical protein
MEGVSREALSGVVLMQKWVTERVELFSAAKVFCSSWKMAEKKRSLLENENALSLNTRSPRMVLFE